MRSNYLKTALKTAVFAVTLLLGASTSFGQVVNLTAGSTTTALPDGQSVPMWGYSCSDAGTGGASCAASNPSAGGGWSPVVIKTAPGKLTINLTNNLSFAGSGVKVPTSLVIVGQVGGGLGAPPTKVASPTHGSTVSWPTPGSGQFTPPPQAEGRVQSFATQVEAGAGPATLTWTGLKPGTYLIESGTHPSIQGPMGLYGVLVVTTAPSGSPGLAYPAAGNAAAVSYGSEVPLVLSEIDPVQNAAVDAAVRTSGFNELTVWSGQPGGCGNPTSSTYQTCYPPAVNYDPRYYLINGVSLDKSNLGRSLFTSTPATPATGGLLVRFVNAGLRMHVPSIVGATTGKASPATPGFALIAEDGNLLPGTPRIQSEVFLAAGKTYDVLINPPTGTATLPVFDRQLSLSTNNRRDGGMQAYIGLNGASTPTAGQLSATANPDSYFLVPGNTLTVSDISKGVIANDVGVYGVKVVSGGTGGSLNLNADGTFTYTAGSGTTSDSFTYCGNGATAGPACATVSLAAAPIESASGITLANHSYTSSVATFIQVGSPGILVGAVDAANYPLTVDVSSISAQGGMSVQAAPAGGFTATASSPGTYTFTYKAKNSQGIQSANSATVSVTFPTPSGLKVHVYDAPLFQQGTLASIGDYRWIIEEDRTFNINPTTENAGTGTVPDLGTSFHTSYMPIVAAGCTGALSCESGQTVYDPTTKQHVPAVCDVGDGACRINAAQQTPVDPSQVVLDPKKRYYISIIPGDAGNAFTAGGGGATSGTGNVKQVGTTVTVTVPPGGSGLVVGDQVSINNSSLPSANGTFIVTGVTDTSFTYTTVSSCAAPSTCTASGVSFGHQFDIAADCGVYSTSGPTASNWTPGTGTCGHAMSGASIGAGVTSVNIPTEETPFPTAKIAAFVFEDDSPLNGENDVHGGTDTQGTSREPGLGGFELRLFDAAGGTGDSTGQMTYDMFNYPLSNSLAGTTDQLTGLNACPITANADGLVGMIVTCPHFESDGKTVSPLAGQAVISNMMPGRYGVQADPGADRIARGEEWLQTNTLDGQKSHDAFIKVGGPAYFQEFGPAGFHVAIGFANPKIINDRLAPYCAAAKTAATPNPCGNTIKGMITDMHQSRTPDQRLYSTGSHDALAFTQCYVSFGDPDDDDIAFTKCNADGTFTLTGVPDGSWRLTLFDQWNDQIVDGLSTPVAVAGGKTLDMGQIAVQQWHTNMYTRTYIDLNGDGVSQPDEPGAAFVDINNRFRDGSYSNFNSADLNGYAGYNEIFPLFNWYVIDTDTTRFKQTGVHVVYDAGGPVDGTTGGADSNIAANLATTTETYPLPSDLRFPGSFYCSTADCTDSNFGKGTTPGGGTGGSTGRVDPPWVVSEAWQGFIGSSEFVEFGKKPFAPGENGGIHGEVIYASTRPFDDPALLIHTSWTPDVPNVTINLYQEGTAFDGTKSLKLVDTTVTSSWDNWAQGFRGSSAPNALSSITVSKPGAGYGPVTSVALSAGGSGYTSVPNVTIYGGGSGATATATVTGGVVTALTLKTPGLGYVNPTVVIDAPANGTQATATAAAAAPPAVAIDAPPVGGTQAVGKAVLNADGGVSSVNIVNGGSGYTAAPNVTFTATVGSGATGLASVTTGAAKIPNMNCPGLDQTSPFFFTLKNSTQFLDPNSSALPYNSAYKCYDGLSTFNQVQPAPYDGAYQFPSVTSRDANGKPVGTNCNICQPNTATDNKDWYYGTPMLPAGKYVVEMILPTGYELVKEEDKNILIGDNYIAPVTQQFGGIGSIFILPDQAEVASEYNPNNAQNSTNNLGVYSEPVGEGDTGSIEMKWPCVGQARIVPDYISLFPGSQQAAPFAGATRNLCDRKEVVLGNETSALAKFWVFSSTHVAAHFTGIMLDDLSSEFDPFSPQFGEKFAIPNVPVSLKDQNGIEIFRTYTDQWGIFNGLNYSTWEVNPPNPTGYAPTMMVACMNDPGTGVTPDPQFNPNYSQFCYEIPFMPGQTQYMDTPVVPTAAFADGYNVPDCSYPDATPSIASVLGDSVGGGAGPYVSAPGKSLTINALGKQMVPNQAYSGPSATAAPFNQKYIQRNYGFGGSQGTGSVTIGGVTATVTSWSDSQIVVNVPAGIPSCSVVKGSFANAAPLQKQGPRPAGNFATWPTYAASCGELVVTAGNGKQSVDTVTVTVGGKAPTYVAGENASNTAIQNAIDAAAPGDLIIVGPGTYQEMLLMWKPVRLQGVGAASVTINANTHPSGKMDPWRKKVECLFGISVNGTAITKNNPFDTTNAQGCSFVDSVTGLGTPQVDPIPLEPVSSWDSTLNGNLAELLQEPTLLGAYEGAAITVLGKGLASVNGGTRQHPVLVYDPNCIANGVCTTLTASNADCATYPSNFLCNPSRIDGFSVVNSSQGGGGIFLHGFNHFTEVSNNRVHSNAGTLSGGITVGQAESPDGTIAANNQELPFLFNTYVNIHNNAVTQNSSYGDEINSSTTEAAGGVTFCTGSDYYLFNQNWVCGNLSTGDGGGFVHFGLSYDGQIRNNKFLFNQTNNITLPTNGGGLAVIGAPPDGPVCENSVVDVDCPPSLSDGVGPGMVIDSNLIQGNSAESGSGGGIRLQSVNGTEVARFPTRPGSWYDITVINNIITNNVAGWDGAGISMQDALNVSFINNTVASNDTTASSGVLFNTLGAPNANTPPPTNGGGSCDPTVTPNCDTAGTQVISSTPQPAGLVTMQHTPNLVSSLPATIDCPVWYTGGGPNNANGTCRKVSLPLVRNDIFWQNRAFNIKVGDSGSGALSQQHLVTLTPSLSQTKTGDCVNGANYWDIGVRGDTSPTAPSPLGFKINPANSILTSTTGYAASNQSGNPALIAQYCNGSRVPPENGGLGYIVPPGISDATTPNPIFNLTPAATVDEGNNWINMAFGPLSLMNQISNTEISNYSIAAGSPAINTGVATGAPNHDYFGTKRPQGTGYDIGAVEFVSAPLAVVNVTGGPLAFGNVAVNTTSAAQTLTLHNTGNVAFTGGVVTVTAPFAQLGGSCTGTLAPAATCTITVVFKPTALGPASGTATITGSVIVTGSPVALTGTGIAAVTSATLTPVTFTYAAKTRNCPGTGLGALACLLDQAQTFTLTNTGNVTLTGLGASTIGGLNANEFALVPLLTTCGTSGLVQTVNLAPNATCNISVQFKPLTAFPTGVKTGTISITAGAAGVKTSTLTGTAN